MKEKLSVKQIVSLVCIGIIFSVVLAGNIVAGYFGEMITTYFYGSGIEFGDNETFSQAIAESLELNVKIAEEGIVMVKNENNALPMKDEELEKAFEMYPLAFALATADMEASLYLEEKK